MRTVKQNQGRGLGKPIGSYTRCARCGREFTKEELEQIKKDWPSSSRSPFPVPCPDIDCQGHIVPICDTCAKKKEAVSR